MAYGAMPNQPPALITMENADLTRYNNSGGQAGFAPSCHQVSPATTPAALPGPTAQSPAQSPSASPFAMPVTTIQPPVVDPLSSYVSTARYEAMSPSNLSVQAGSLCQRRDGLRPAPLHHTRAKGKGQSLIDCL